MMQPFVNIADGSEGLKMEKVLTATALISKLPCNLILSWVFGICMHVSSELSYFAVYEGLNRLASIECASDTTISNVAKPGFIRFWCGAHQLDIVLQDVYLHFGDEKFMEN
ncbi:hypothetical protein DD237_000519 [Peronospora effusa]|uniref:Uncharacterized protein n=1 Tax=Peronospora effusa TaxID=542832 RepID=A0A425CIG0_9STRA|nr:hypothetical protein DD237_000519 [Peronospora effusa]